MRATPSPPSPLAHHEHAEVGQVSRHAEHGGLEVLLVAGQVDEGDDLWGFLTDLGPVQAAAVAVWLVHHLTERKEQTERIQDDLLTVCERSENKPK